MSHEIRTPLNGVLGFTSLLAGEVERGNVDLCREYMHTIESSSRHLLVLINDALVRVSCNIPKPYEFFLVIVFAVFGISIDQPRDIAFGLVE